MTFLSLCKFGYPQHLARSCTGEAHSLRLTIFTAPSLMAHSRKTGLAIRSVSFQLFYQTGPIAISDRFKVALLISPPSTTQKSVYVEARFSKHINFVPKASISTAWRSVLCHPSDPNAGLPWLSCLPSLPCRGQELQFLKYHFAVRLSCRR